MRYAWVGVGTAVLLALKSGEQYVKNDKLPSQPCKVAV